MGLDDRLWQKVFSLWYKKKPLAIALKSTNAHIQEYLTLIVRYYKVDVVGKTSFFSLLLQDDGRTISETGHWCQPAQRNHCQGCFGYPPASFETFQGKLMLISLFYFPACMRFCCTDSDCWLLPTCSLSHDTGAKFNRQKSGRWKREGTFPPNLCNPCMYMQNKTLVSIKFKHYFFFF